MFDHFHNIMQLHQQRNDVMTVKNDLAMEKPWTVKQTQYERACALAFLLAFLVQSAVVAKIFQLGKCRLSPKLFSASCCLSFQSLLNQKTIRVRSVQSDAAVPFAIVSKK